MGKDKPHLFYHEKREVGGNSIRILLVEDERDISEVVYLYLVNDGYHTDVAENGKKALELFESRDYDLVILDLMLPDIPGEEIAEKIRMMSDVPIIMLTAKVDEEDIVKGLRIGADDYITKPFSMKVLLARIDAVLRRKKGARNADLLNLGDVKVDFSSGILECEGKKVRLTSMELKLLSVLTSTPGKVWKRSELLRKVWEIEDVDSIKTRVLDVTVKNLRKKFRELTEKYEFIHTDFGVGYHFEIKEVEKSEGNRKKHRRSEG